MRRAIRPGLPVVVKVGSSSLARPEGGLDPEAVERVVSQVVELREGGHPPVLVSSGAIAAGLPALGLDRRPRDVPGLQVAAAVGQGRLMERYAARFSARGVVVGQVLLTRDVLARREQYLHAREALGRMLELGVVPVVNENDTVAVEELKLGDNDRLAAIVAQLVGAGLLVILTDTEGLYLDDPRLADEPELITAVRHTDTVLDELRARSAAGEFGSGGVGTKIAAARMAAFSGIPTVVAGAAVDHAPLRAAAGEDVGTWVEPRASSLPARKLWIAFGQPAEGVVVVDDGARRALVERGRSLLPAGVVEVRGDFAEGAAVEIEADGRLVGKGLVRVDARRLRGALGAHSRELGDVVVHRDDLVVLA